MNKKSKTKAKRPRSVRKKRAVWYVVVGIIFVLAVTLYVLCHWFLETFHVGLNELFYTLASPLKGVGIGIATQLLRECLPPILICAGIYVLLVLIDSLRWATLRITGSIWGRSVTLDIRKAFRRIVAILLLAALPLSLYYIDTSVGLVDYLKERSNATRIYEDYYVDPLSVDISAEGETQNLLYIYLESMETTYASVSDGGYQEINFIPNLTALAQEHISFSNTALLGGLHSAKGSGWTMGALLASTSGVPFAFPVHGNAMGEREFFASGLTTLGDILDQRGYTQEFLCGSDSDYAGRRTYFEQHGNYEMFDLYTAREQGYISENYSVWWGYEDEYLFEIAKDELLRLADGDSPFNLTMLTADPHHEGGYVCSLCEDTYEEQLQNVLICADSQLAAFIEWLQQQDFYENTTVVITGDHPRMDTILVDGVSYYDRTIYNCFLNAAAAVEGETTNRECSTLDLFPTVLAAMGFQIEGNRLGLGTNLFSAEQTLPELLGYENVNAELGRYSSYYLKNFS